ncbi:MAG: metallophosphoesterase [Leptospira sp.]|nr:metallophosphoesterase [Leptospira sp.]
MLFFFWTVISILILLTPLSYFASIFLNDSTHQKTFAYTAFLSLGFFSILFSLILFHDIAILIGSGIHFIAGLFGMETEIISPSPETVSTRKEFLLNSLRLGIVGFAGGLTAYGIYEVKKRIQVKEIEIPVAGLHPDLDGFRIVQISDVHVGPTIKIDFIHSIKEVINTLDADLVAITGDLVDGPVTKLREHVAPLADLKSRYGSYFVTGNHDYYSGALSWIREIQSLGISVLLNEHKILDHGKAKFLIAGVTDYKAHTIIPSHFSDPHKSVSGAKDSDFKLLLAHQPNSIYEATKAGFDLQLSGHTHGGQFFPGNFLIHLFQEFVAGLHLHENTQLYVSRGTGYWGPPIRVGSPSEITLITLKKV